MRISERFKLLRPLEDMEVALVRAVASDPRFLSAADEAVLRHSLSLARLYKVRQDGRDVGVSEFLRPFREEVTLKLRAALLGPQGPRKEALLPLVGGLRQATLRTNQALRARFATRLDPESIDREVRHKSLVLVSGGGGGTGYVYIGAMSLLDEFGFKPALLVGTSIGSVLSLFRSRVSRFDLAEISNIVRGLTWRRLFRAISGQNRYGLPAALRLFLRSGIGRYFEPAPGSGDHGVRLSELPIPTIITVGGIRRGKLPHPLGFYEQVFTLGPRALLNPAAMMGRLQAAFGALAELFNNPELMVRLHLGADQATREFDALDAVGFSCSLPGVIHYDVLRDDPRMRSLLDELLDSKKIFRLVDGGLVDNVAAKAAWSAVHRGRIGTRNAFIMALNGFAPKLSTPLWLPLERMAELNVAPNRPYAHLFIDFKKTLSPLELVPSVKVLAHAIELGRRQLKDELPFVARMLAPLPPLG